MVDVPCRNCITLGICRNVGVKTNGVPTLALKCCLIDAYITSPDHPSEWDIELMYEMHDFFKRGIIDY